jgi:HEPN domain-containing protein
MPSQPESVACWMEYARTDLLAAKRSAGPGVLWHKPCYDLQQATEKALKAVLIHYGIVPPRTHFLDDLIKLLPPQTPRSADLIASTKLTDYAVVTRYPGQPMVVSEEDYDEALPLAEFVVDWAAEITGK